MKPMAHVSDEKRTANMVPSGELSTGFGRVLDPMDRISEILFGLIMVLTYTSTLSIVTEDPAPVRTMLIGALGCNLAWGIIDAGLYLLDRLNEQGRNLLTVRAVRAAPDPDAARRIIEDALPSALASALPAENLELMRKKLHQMPVPTRRPRLTKSDWIGALGVCLLVFLCTFPVVIPFIFMSDAQVGIAGVECRCCDDAVSLRLRVRTPQRGAPLGDGSFDGCRGRFPCCRCDSAGRMKSRRVSLSTPSAFGSHSTPCVPEARTRVIPRQTIRGASSSR